MVSASLLPVNAAMLLTLPAPLALEVLGQDERENATTRITENRSPTIPLSRDPGGSLR